MKNRQEEAGKIARLVFKHLKDHSLITARESDEKILGKIEAVYLKNLQDETDIEQETKKIMEQYRAQIASGAVDSQKIYSMIKKQVAKDKKFIL